MILVFFMTYVRFHENLGLIMQRNVTAQEILQSTELEAQPSATVKEQHSHIFRVYVFFHCITLQKKHIQSFFLLHSVLDPLIFRRLSSSVLLLLTAFAFSERLFRSFS